MLRRIAAVIRSVKERAAEPLGGDLIFRAGSKNGCTAYMRYLQEATNKLSDCKITDNSCEQLGSRVLAKAGKMIERNFSVRHR